MKYAVIAISGSQFKVEENQVISVDKIDLKDGETGTSDQVLLLVNDDKVQVGAPTVKGAQVEYKIVKNYRGEKTRVFKYRSKSRYRRTMGFRPEMTDIQIIKING